MHCVHTHQELDEAPGPHIHRCCCGALFLHYLTAKSVLTFAGLTSTVTPHVTTELLQSGWIKLTVMVQRTSTIQSTYIP